MSFRATLAAAIIFFGAPAVADTIAVIGTGDVGGALGPAFAGQGHTIVYGSRDPERNKVKELVANTGEDASATTRRMPPRRRTSSCSPGPA